MPWDWWLINGPFGFSNLKKGKQKCKLWLGKEADGLAETTTSSVSDLADEIERLEKVRD